MDASLVDHVICQIMKLKNWIFNRQTDQIGETSLARWYFIDYFTLHDTSVSIYHIYCILCYLDFHDFKSVLLDWNYLFRIQNKKSALS